MSNPQVQATDASTPPVDPVVQPTTPPVVDQPKQESNPLRTLDAMISEQQKIASEAAKEEDKLNLYGDLLVTLNENFRVIDGVPAADQLKEILANKNMDGKIDEMATFILKSFERGGKPLTDDEIVNIDSGIRAKSLERRLLEIDAHKTKKATEKQSQAILKTANPKASQHLGLAGTALLDKSQEYHNSKKLKIGA
jgi:hypothetical protein